MQKLATALTDYVIDRGVVKEEERETYEYGFQTALESIMSMIISILIAVRLQMVFEGILFFIIFIPLRFYAGGLHLNHYLSCLILSCLTYLGVLLTVKYVEISSYVSFLIFIILIMAVLLLYPVEHVNRPVDKEEKIYFKKRLREILLIDTSLAIICLFLKKGEYLSLMMLTFLLMVITMSVGKIQYNIIFLKHRR